MILYCFIKIIGKIDCLFQIICCSLITIYSYTNNKAIHLGKDSGHFLVMCTEHGFERKSK